MHVFFLYLLATTFYVLKSCALFRRFYNVFLICAASVLVKSLFDWWNKQPAGSLVIIKSSTCFNMLTTLVYSTTVRPPAQRLAANISVSPFLPHSSYRRISCLANASTTTTMMRH